MRIYIGTTQAHYVLKASTSHVGSYMSPTGRCTSDAQIPCSENTYNPEPGAHLITNCTRCTERTSTLGRAGASSADACSCSADFYLAPEWIDWRNMDECKAGSYNTRCCVCPIGSEVHSLPPRESKPFALLCACNLTC